MSYKKQKLLLILFIITAMNFYWYGCSQESEIDYKCPDCNVILIIIDTLRADHLGCYGYSVENTYYFLGNLGGAEIITEKSKYVREPKFTINDEQRNVLFEYPNSEVVFKDVPISKNAKLKFGIGINEMAWGKKGDGVLFEISIVEEQSQNISLFSKYINPKNNVEDRKWFDEQIDLSAFAEQKVSFTFKTTSGPKGNGAFNWAGWSHPKVIPYSETSGVKSLRHVNGTTSIDRHKAEKSVGTRRETSPNIDALAKQSFLFKNAFSSSSWTRSAISSILTSKLPIEHMITSENLEETLSESFFTIQEFFNERNYNSAAFYTNPHLNFGLVQNFNYTHFAKGGAANLIYDKAIDWIKSNSDNKFFLLIHNNDVHAPYEFHEEFSFTSESSKYRRMRDLLPPNRKKRSCDDNKDMVYLDKEQLSEIQANYDGEIAFVDYQIGRLIDYLNRALLLNKTILIITADHGEEFLDHGGYSHGCTLYNELLKVPLIIYLPGYSKSKIIEQKVGTVDIFPTLVDIFDKESLPKHTFSGQSLLPLLENKKWEEKSIFSATAFRVPLKYSLVIGDYKIIKYAEGDIIGIYDLRNDPHELDNLINRDLKLVNFLNGSLSRKVTSVIKETIDRNEIELDKETLEQLKALGYMN